MGTFNNMISQLLNKAPSGSDQAESPNLHKWDNTRLLPPASDEHHEELSDHSPTPKRRKLTQSSPIANSMAFVGPSKKLEPTAPIVIDIENRNVRHSPASTAKSVAFSDKVESSPTQRTIKSSPRVSPTLKPSKSILRNPVELVKSRSDLTFDKFESASKLAGRGSATSHSSRVTDPSSLKYWTSGEVHNLRDASNVKLFKQILEGGLKILDRQDSESIARRFEIYATFNTIFPIVPAKMVSQVAERKASVVIGLLDKIVDICLPQLRQAQEKLLVTEDKKDPFVSRLYIQIVRLFGSILANHRVVRSLAQHALLKDRLKEVYQVSSVALTHTNSNKAIIGAQFSLLAEEKYGSYFLNKIEVLNIVKAVFNSKEIQSANLLCEKLSLLRSLVSNHTRVMLDTLQLWLPYEVLSRTLMENDNSTLTILQAAISVLLELLKRTIDSPTVQQEIIKCIRGTLAKDALPKQLHDEINKDPTQRSLTLEELVQQQITYLIVFAKEYKLAMDLWLAMMGLLYNTTGTLVELSNADSHGWLKLNHICFLSSDSSTKFMALKAWRIIVYCIYSHIKGKSLDQDLILIRLLKRPFELTATYHSDLNVCEGILYYLSGLVYTTCGNSLSHHASQFTFFWDKLVAPIFSDYIFGSKSILLRSRAVKLLSKLISSDAEDRSQKKSKPPIKVISSAGITIKDIQSVPADVLQKNYEPVEALIFAAIRSDLADWVIGYELFASLIRLLPSELADEKHFAAFQLVALDISTVGKPSNSRSMFLRLSSAMAGPFGDLIFRDKQVFQRLLETFEYMPEHHPESKLEYLKELSKSVKGRVSDLRINERLLEANDAFCKQYVSNWISSVLLSPDISQADFKSLVNIVRSLRSAAAIENLLRLCSKYSPEGTVFELLMLDEWNDDEYTLFVKTYLNYTRSGLQEKAFKSELKRALQWRQGVFDGLIPVLLSLGPSGVDFIKGIIVGNSRLVNSLLPKYSNLAMEIMPADQLSSFILDFEDFSRDAQPNLIKWVLSLDKPEELFTENGAVVRFLFPDSPENDYAALKGQILKALYEHGSWSRLSEFIVLCVARDQKCVSKLFGVRKYAKISKLSPMAFAAMVDKCETLKPKLYSHLKEVYRNQEIESNLELTECLLASGNFQSFSFCREEFLAFLLIKPQHSEETVKSKCKFLANTFIAKLMTQQTELIIPFVRSMQRMMALNLTAYTSEVFDMLIKRPKMQYMINNLSLDDALLESLLNLQQNLNATLCKGDVASEKTTTHDSMAGRHESHGDQQNQSTALLDSSRSEDVRRQSDVQVPATQTVGASDARLPSAPEVLKRIDKLDNGETVSSAVNGKVRDNKPVVSEKNEGDRVPSEKELIGSSTESTLGGNTQGSCDAEVQHSTQNRNTTTTASQDQNLKRWKRGTTQRQDGDDFADAEVEQDDEFLRTMESKLSATSNEMPSADRSRSTEIPGTQSAAVALADTDDASVIRFPIFNTSKVSGAAAGDGVESAKVKDVPSVSVISNSEPLNGLVEESGKQGDLSRLDDMISQEATPSLRIHFPSKKVRRLVSRMRTFTIDDVSNLTQEEKRNLRIEVLDFLMNLEHERGN